MTKTETKRMLKGLQVLRLEPGDVLVVTMPNEHIPPDVRDRVREACAEALLGRKVLVAPKGMTFAAIRRAAG